MITARDVTLSYGTTNVLTGVDLNVLRSEVVALTGRSGSGKSSLLHCLAGVLRPQSGSIRVAGTDLVTAPETEVSDVRRREFGFVLQFGRLVGELTAVENVSLPLRLNGMRRRPSERKALEALEQVGLGRIGGRTAATMSGGEQQRAAVARALVHGPSVVFADEPTGALDSCNGRVVLDLLLASARERGAAVVLVTHDDEVASCADRRVRMVDGRLVEGPGVEQPDVRRA